MADTNANIRIDVDATAALAQIKQLQRQISLFHTNMAKGGAAAAAEAQNLQRNLVNSINATGQFTANMTRIKTTTESFTNALEKNKLSMGQYFRYAGASTKTFGSLFKSEFATINKVARERVKDLQTQYIKMGRDASGAMQAIKVRPLTLDLQNLGTQTAIAAQKQALLNQLIKQGSTNLLNWGKNTQWAGRQLMVGFTIPLTIMGSVASREFMKLEEQAIKFKRVYGDMFTTEAETQKAIKDIKELANEFTKYGIAVEKTVGLAASVAQMGATGADLMNQVTEATRLAVLGGIEQQEALDTTISLTNAFGLATEELTDKIAFLNAAENQTILSIEDFNEAIPKAGSVVKQLGGDVEDLAYFLTAMREGGINASQAANALKSSLARLINPTEVSVEKLSEFGIDILGIVNTNAGDLRSTIQVLAVELDKLDPLNKARAIEQLFGKFQFARMSTLFENIVKEGSQANKVLELSTYNARELGIIAERELGRVEASSMFKFQKALEEFQVALAPIGEAFLKLVTPIVQFGTRLLDKFNELGDGAKTFVVGFIGLVGIIGPAVLMMVGLLANGIANLLLFGTKVSGAFSKASGSSNLLTEQLNYMNSEQIESSAVAASLDQIHQTLIQTFNAEAGAVANLTAAYSNSIAAQRAFLGGRGATGASGSGRGGAPKPSTNPFMPPKYADGILSVPGPKGAGDIVAAMLSPGEAVIPADMAKKYAPFINSIIADNVPGFAYGKTVGGRVVEETHVAPALPQTSTVVNLLEDLIPGFGKLSDKLREAFTVLGDLTATKTKDLNQQAKGLGRPVQDPKAGRAMTGEEFKEEWNVTEGTGFDRTAERAGLVKLDKGMPGTAQEGTYEEGVPEALSELDREVGDRVAARIDAMPETEKAVKGWLDRLMEEVTQEVISEFAQESGTAKAKVATAMAGRAATPGGVRTVGVQDIVDDKTGDPYGSAAAFFDDMEEQGQLERREGRQGLFVPDSDIKAGRPDKKGGFRTNSLSDGELAPHIPGGVFGSPRVTGGDTQPVDEIQQAYLNGQNIAEAQNDGVESAIKDPKDISDEKVGRNSPHPDAFPDGADDAKAYMEGQESVLGPGSDPYRGGPLAPPPPPSASGGGQSGGRFSRFKDKAKSIGNQAMDKFLETAPGQGIGNYFAETSGADITNSKGEVVATAKEQPQTQRAPRQYAPGESPSEIQARNQALVDQRLATFDAETGTMFATTTGKIAGLKDSFSVLDTEITELGNTSQDSAADVDKHTQSVRENGDAATQSSAEMDAAEGGGKRGRRGKKAKGQKGGRRGITGGGAGLSMGLSALTMGASMAPGALGEQAQKFMPALMALSAAPMLFQAMQSPLVALGVGILAVAGSIFMLNKKMKDSQKEAMELGKALGAGTEAMKSLADFAGTVSAGEFMDKAREERLKGVETAPGKTTFGESFVQDEKGQALVAAAKTQIAQTGDVTATINSFTNQLATAVMTGVLTKEQASSMAANLGFALNNMEIGLQVRANIAQLVGPSGEDITGGDLVEFSAKVNADNMKAVDDQIELMNRNLEGVFGDEQAEIWGGTIAAGVGGAVVGGIATAATSAGLIATGVKLGATIGTAMGGPIGLAIGAGVGMAAGAIGAYFVMKKNAEEAGKLSGAVVASVTNALQQQQEMSDSVDAYYIKKLEEAKVQGDITEQLRLQSEYEQKKVELSEQEMAMREQLRGALTGPGAEAARIGIDAAIETRFKDDADAKLVLPGIEAAMKTLDFSEAETDTINFELASGAISPMALNSLLTFVGEDDAKKEALIDVIGTFGGVFADEASQVLSLIDDEELAADIFVNISNAGNEQEAQEILDFVREIQRQDSVFDTDVILNYMAENEDVAEGLQEIFDRAAMGVVTVSQAYEINPELRNAEAFDALYFESLPDMDKEQYVKTVSMILEMDEAQLLASDDFKKWTGDEGAIHGPFPGSKHSLAAWQRLYAESMGQKVTSQLSSVDTTIDEEEQEEETSGGGGGGPKASDLDDLLKKLREVRQSTIEMTQGWVESRNALDRLFDDGGEIKIFQGIEQQMRKIGAGEDLISMIIGMDPEEYERRKDELFQFDNAGNIIGATTALQNMGKALRSIALGDFQSEQQRVIGGLNEQMVAFRKLTAAGLSAAMAYDAVKDAAFAAAVAREQDNNVIRETIRLTRQAVELSRAFQAAQSIARKNQDTADLSGVVKFIEKNAQSLSEAQKSAILSDPELQTLIMNPSVDPKTLRKALANASKQEELELRIKKLTFEGLQEIFSDGFSKAMEAFSAKETEIALEFDIKKDPFLEAVQEAEEAISDIRNRAGGLDDLEADVERISRQEEEINDTYDKRLEALDKIGKVNESINRKKKAQLDVADALSQGDIAAAARAARQASEEAAKASLEARRDQLEVAREEEIARLTGNMGLTREQLEQRIKALQEEIFNIEEQRLEPAQRQIELLDREQAVLIENLTVLGRTREEWDRIKNEVDLANVNSEKFQKAMQEALDVVKDITSYWEDMNGEEVDLFVNVKQQGSVDDIIDAIQAPPPKPDPSSGGGGKTDEDIMSEFRGKTVGPTGRPTGQALEATRVPLQATRADMALEERMVVDQRRVVQAQEELDAAKAELDRLKENRDLMPLDARATMDVAIENQRLVIAEEEGDLANAQEKSNDSTAQFETRQQERALGDPMAVFNTGAANLLDATNFLFANLRDASGQVTGDIAGLFSDLGVNAPTLMKGIPGFFDYLSDVAPEKIQDMSTQAANFFNTLAANVGANINGIGNVLSQMSTTATDELGAELLAFSDDITTLPETWDAAGLSTWFDGLSDDAKKALNEGDSPLAQAMLDLGIKSVEDLEGTLGTFWDVLPTSIGDIFEGEITPFIEEQAAAMGISVEEFLGKSFSELPEDIQAKWDSGFAARWNEFQLKAVQAIATPQSLLGSMGDNVDPELQKNIGNALRGAAAEGAEEFARVQGVLAGLPRGTDVKAAFEGTAPGSLGALAKAGAELAATELDVIPEAIGNIPEDELVTTALESDLPENFGASGTASGNRFGTGAVTSIASKLATYQGTNPSITITVKYRDEKGRAVDKDGNLLSNDGGFISSSMVRRNNGGIIPYGKGGIAKYGMGGMAKYLAGGVVGGFGNYDNVPAILTPGEFVIRREAVEKYGRNFFENLNSTIYNTKPRFSTPSYDTASFERKSGKMSDSKNNSVMYNNNYSVSVNVKSDSNPDEIAQTVIRQIKQVDAQRIRGNRF